MDSDSPHASGARSARNSRYASGTRSAVVTPERSPAPSVDGGDFDEATRANTRANGRPRDGRGDGGRGDGGGGGRHNPPQGDLADVNTSTQSLSGDTPLGALLKV